MRCSVKYGGKRIGYELVENDALTKKVRIHVHANGNVEVEAPVSISLQDVTRAVYKRAGWISRKLDEASSFREHVLPREYVSGETHFYLGRRYQLKLIEAKSKTSSVKLKAGEIAVELADLEKSAVRQRLNDWYRMRAAEYLTDRLEDVALSLPWVEKAPQLKLVSATKQWGSCSPSGTINLNPWLIRAPRECIDYVLVHELCHLKEHNHSERFYALLDKHCADWRHTKAKLDGMAELLLAS